jgi:hypothetical protein
MKRKPSHDPDRQRSPAEQENYNLADCVETASVDSFPARDPPGWICTAAKAKSAKQGDDRER